MNDNVSLKGKKVIVTGGCGFIGSHLVEALWRDNQVLVVDNLVSGSRSNIGACEAELVCCDILDDLDPVFAGADVIFHTAAEVQVVSSVMNPVPDARTNILGLLNVINTARRMGIERIVFSSSAAVYGVPQSLPISETHPTHPISPYGLSKLTGERYLLMYQALENLPAVCLRYFNVFGPRQVANSPYSGVISIFARNLIEGKPSVIYGDGGQSRDFLHVSDVVRANLLAAVSPAEKVVGRVFNVGTGNATTLNDLVNLLNLPSGSVTYAPERPGDIRYSVAEVRSAGETMGFHAAMPLADGLKDYVAWLRQT